MKKRHPISTIMLVTAVLVIITSGCKKNEEEESSIIKDGDGNVYTSVTIGNQVWLKQNLKTTKFNDGTAIPLVTGNTEWNDLSTPGYCWYNNDEATYKSDYGALYNWYAVGTGKLCPKGWRAPTNDDMDDLLVLLGDYQTAGGKLKEEGTTHWNSPNEGATDDYGFSFLPGGYRNYTGTFAEIRITGGWWNITENSAHNNEAYVNILTKDFAPLGVNNSVSKKNGDSVRCLKD
jgi:uncharacterized protein (TIGR02145 family)